VRHSLRANVRVATAFLAGAVHGLSSEPSVAWRNASLRRLNHDRPAPPPRGGPGGAAWVDVIAETYPPECQGWVLLRRRSRTDTPNTRAWREMQRTVEAVALAAMVAPGAPF
jgi:hypothetical protein